MKDVILHAFNWSFNDIARNAQQIADIGYGGVLFPPILYSDETVPDWWQRYQPKDYRILRSFLGRKSDIVNAVNALNDAGVRSYADVVFNHMANDKEIRQKRGYSDFYHFPGRYELERYKKERNEFEKDKLYGNLDDGLFQPQDFNPEGDIVWENCESVKEKWLNQLPDIDMNDWVIDQQCTCLRALNDLGFSGYRVDAMKHLPTEHLLRVFTIDAMRQKLVFGEVLTTKDDEELDFMWPIIKNTKFPCTDFVLHETLRQVFSPNGSMRTLIDPAAYGLALPWNRAIIFSSNHDLMSNETFRGLLLNSQDEYLANVYLMGRDGGVPMIYSDNNESVNKHPEDRDRWANAWKRYDIIQMIRFHNALHGTQQRPIYENDGFIVLARGDCGILAINKTEQWQSPTIWTLGLRHGKYRCQIHQHIMHVQGDFFNFSIPPRQAQMWLFENG
jgi:alpha-amylase